VPPTLPPKDSEEHDEFVAAHGREKPPPLSLSPSLSQAPPPLPLHVSMHGGARIKELEDEVAKLTHQAESRKKELVSSTDKIASLHNQLMELEEPQDNLKRRLVDAEGEMEALQLKVCGYDAAQQLLLDAWQQLQGVVQEIRLVHQMCVCAKEDAESAADQEREREMARDNELRILVAEMQLAQKVSHEAAALTSQQQTRMRDLEDNLAALQEACEELREKGRCMEEERMWAMEERSRVEDELTSLEGSLLDMQLHYSAMQVPVCVCVCVCVCILFSYS
jgi:chromosome segregation ATPase